MDNQQRSPVYHRELCSMLCVSLDGRAFGGRMDTCTCMAESLCYPPETITELLISYTPIQIKSLKINKYKCFAETTPHKRKSTVQNTKQHRACIPADWQEQQFQREKIQVPFQQSFRSMTSRVMGGEASSSEGTTRIPQQFKLTGGRNRKSPVYKLQKLGKFQEW